MKTFYIPLSGIQYGVTFFRQSDGRGIYCSEFR